MRLINATQLVNELKWCEVCNLSKEEIINIIDKQPSIYYPAVINIKYLTAEDKNTLFKALKKNGLNTIALYAESDLTERTQGEWVYGEDDCGQDGWFCSECNFFVPWYYQYYKKDIDFIRDYKACPHCLVEMVTYTGKDRDTKGGAE